MSTQDNAWGSTADAARELGIDRTTVYRWLVGGVFDHLPNAIRWRGRKALLHIPTIVANAPTRPA